MKSKTANSKDQSTQNIYRPWNYYEWEKINGGNFKQVRFIIQGTVGACIRDIHVKGLVGGNNIIFKSAKYEGSGLSVDFKAIKSVSNTLSISNDRNWELVLYNGARIYLDDPIM